MDFYEEDDRPRFVLQSKSIPATATTAADATGNFSFSSLHKPTLVIALSLSILFFTFSIFLFPLEPFRSLFLWLATSFLIGPFAPLSLTAGDIRVGVGPPVQPPPPIPQDETIAGNKKSNRKSVKNQPKLESFGVGSCVGGIVEVKKDESRVGSVKNENKVEVEEGKWSEGDVELLKKLMGKHPVGKPGRWEAITDGFKGRYKMDGVIKKAKELGDKKTSNEDSYQRFLKDRKVVDSRVEAEIASEHANGVVGKGGESAGSGWSSGEDLALLNALKTFPKDVSMRWEKIAAAVPGKTKAACMKRVTELKRDFRSSKAASSEA